MNIANNNMQARGCQQLVDSLVANSENTLKKLYIGSNGIESEGATQMARFTSMAQGGVEDCCRLTILEMPFNKIGCPGAEDLADSLRLNKSLTLVNLRGNDIRNSGACALCDALCVNRRLVELNISKNLYTDNPAIAVSIALLDNDIIKKIDMSENHLSTSKAVAALARGLLKNYTCANLLYTHIPDEHTEGETRLEDLRMSVGYPYATFSGPERILRPLRGHGD